MSQITTNCATNESATWTLLQERSADITSAEGREPWGLAGEFKASRRWQDRRSSTPQGKDSIEKTTRTVIDTVEEADDRRYASVLQPSIRSNHPHCIWLQSEELRRSAAAQRERRPQASEERRPSLPSQPLESFHKSFQFHIFFLPFAGDAETGGAVGRFSNWNITLGARAINARSTFHQFHKNQGTPLLQSWAGNELPRNTSATLTRCKLVAKADQSISSTGKCKRNTTGVWIVSETSPK